MNYFRRANKPDDPPEGGGGAGEPGEAAAASPDAENMAAQTDAEEDGAPHPEGGGAAVAVAVASHAGGDSASANEGGEQAAILQGILDAPEEDPHHSDELSEGDSGGSYTDDSEYTYVTDDDDEEGPKKGGWFGFMRRGKKAEEEDVSETESEGENEGEHGILEEAAEESDSSDDDRLAHPLLDVASPLASPATVQAREAEEAALLAAAIRRVQRRIDSKGGTLYDALSERDRQLVDSLRGVKDEGKIQEAVARSMEAEFRPPDLNREEGAMVHSEPLAEEEPSLRVENGNAAAGAGAQAGDAMVGMNGGEEDSPDEAGDETTDEEYDDGDDDEQPTIEEQRSLLSLAAEHDRVDVLQELLRGPSSDDPALFASLLAGTSHAGEGQEGADAAFVPPPLHAAVAHGAAPAASCLLRMGADPSLRPVVPAAYRSHGRRPPRRSGAGAGEDRNFKKYHGVSAWELAFGSTIVVEGAGDMAAEEAAEESTTKGGWFGFGASKIEPAPTAPAASASSKPRTKKKAPLNIPPAKREGIQHAFTAEALRAIGSDEVDRLGQLLDAGMAPATEAAGKSLAGWARELDATGCCELLRAQSAEKEVESDEAVDEKGGEDMVVEEVGMPGQNGEERTQTAPQPTAMQDARLAGMSLADARALVRESQASIPPLTACRDDLAAEASFHRSVLKDVAATGGRDGLNSQSLIEAVRALKDRRAEAEEAAAAWQRAWEEREDELDFFWEEVLGDELRRELGGVLNGVSADPNLPVVAGEGTDDMEEWTKRFVEVDNYVNALRTSIASLAEESSRSMAEIESLGMGGALALTGKLKDEVKEIEKNMALARAGEILCRRKIEIIQRRLDRGPAVEENGVAPQEDRGVDIPAAMGGDDEIEDYQLREVVQQQKVHQPEAFETEQHTEAVRDVVSTSPSPIEAPCIADEVAGSESDNDGTGSSADGRSTGDDSEDTDDVDEGAQGEIDHADREEENEGFVEVQRPEAANGGVVNPPADQAAPKTDDVTPSEAIKEGMSTALVPPTLKRAPSPRNYGRSFGELLGWGGRLPVTMTLPRQTPP